METCNLVWGPFTKVTFEEVNLNSPQQMKQVLLDNGWVPDSFTEKGSPQLTESSYTSIKGDLGQLIAKRAILRHRAQTVFNLNKKGELKGWLNNIRSDGRLEAGAMTNGTNTGRMMHRGLVNVPAPTDVDLWPSNIQLRSLITCPDGKELMGIDADSLEAMIEAHCCLPYPNGVEYSKALTSGKLHDNNAAILGVPYKTAKGFKYAVSYGAQAKKLAEVVGCSEAKAQKLFNAFWRNNTALKGFKDAITKYWKARGKKYIRGIDGRKLWARSEHSLVNLYFQSTGSITVKVAMLFMDKWKRQEGLKSQQIMSMHDEYTYEIYPEEKEAIKELATRSFVKASEYLKLRVTVTGTPATGNNWEEIH